MGYRCSVCSKEFELESGLGIHLISEFTNGTPDGGLECDLCGFATDADYGIGYGNAPIVGNEGAERTGNTKLEWEKFLLNQEFDGIRNEMVSVDLK